MHKSSLVLVGNDHRVAGQFQNKFGNDLDLQFVHLTDCLQALNHAEVAILMTHPGLAWFSQDLPRQTLYLVNDVSGTLDNYPKHFSIARINGWVGCIDGEILEITAPPEIRKLLEPWLNKAAWPYRWVPDIPGMVSPRIISMIINEACFALADGVSTKDEIDTAMTLGTNYPMGPFSWADKIGAKEVVELLEILSITDTRYLPAPGIRRNLGIEA